MRPGKWRGRFVSRRPPSPPSICSLRLLVGFVRLHPAVVPELSVSDSSGVYDRLVEGSAAFGFTGARRDDLGLTHEPFAEDDIVLVVFPGQAPATVDLSGLAALPLLVREEGSGTLLTVRVKLRAAGLNLAEVRPAMRLGSTQAVLTAVRAGGGVGFVSRLAAAASLAMEVSRRSGWTGWSSGARCGWSTIQDALSAVCVGRSSSI